jgi:uncharacterized protein
MLRARLTDELKTAMKAQDTRRVSTLRMILAGLKDRDIAARAKGNQTGIDDAEIQQMLQSMVKQRRESITLYEQGGRQELAEQEREEIAVIESFLPKPLSEAETEQAIRDAIAATGAQGIKDMGRVMSVLKERHAGAMDFAKAGPLVKQLLG